MAVAVYRDEGVVLRTVPAGFSPSALPIGLQIMAGPWDEGTALRVARAVERHVVRPAPKVVYDLLS